MLVVVSDAGPLICLGRLDLLRLLPALFAEVQVPDPVLHECTSRWQSPDAARIGAALALGWLTPCGSQQVIGGTLGRGERAAIARALDIGAGLLTDDHGARVHAESLQIAVVGTLGVLTRSKQAGLVPSVAPLIDRLRNSGQRFGQAVVAQVLMAAGEARQ
jgi:predicted nucleic acid-binding protein